MLWKKKCDLKRLFMLLMPGLLPLWANWIACSCSFSGNIILSDFRRTLFPENVILLSIGWILCRSLDAVFKIHVFPDLTVFNSSDNVGSSSVCFAIDEIPNWSMIGVVCRQYNRFCSSSASIFSVSVNVENGFPCLES